jgi:chromosome partitioning protein
MKVIAVYHNKGGVGKTTTVLNLSAALALQGFRVLIVDLDSQANATYGAGLIKFNFDEEDDIKESYIYHLLEGNKYFIPEVARTGSFCSVPIDVVPAHIDLTRYEDQLRAKAASQIRLLDKLSKVSSIYDFVLIDCPPSRDLYAQIGLTSSDYLIIPSDLKPFANRGLINVRELVDEINAFRAALNKPPISILGVLPSKILTNPAFVKNTLPRLENTVREVYQFPLMNTRIFERISLSQCLNQETEIGDLRIPDPKSIFDYSTDSNAAGASTAADEFMQLSKEVLELINSQSR